jgi:hypothetical protein
MSSDASVYLSAVKWSDTSYQLSEFAKEYEFPQIGKIIKGQYMNLGVPSLSSPSLNQIVFWAMGGKRVKVIAQCVRFKEGRNSSSSGSNGRVVPIGPKLAIPDNYDGWWEILSEEGKSVRCIESVSDLAKLYSETCLVRENIKAHIGKQDDPNVISDKVRTIQTGELLTLMSADAVLPNTKSNTTRFVRFRSSKGDTIYLNMDQRGKFSPVAKEDNISGVHTISNLLSKRLPLMVRLVHGKPPQGLKNFHSDMRLFSSYEEECFVAMPLLKDTQSIIQVPISYGLKILAPKNADELCKLKEFSALNEMSKKLMHDLTDKIQVLDLQVLNKDLKASLKEDKGKFAIKFQCHHYDHKRRLQSNFLVKRSLSDPQQLIHQHLNSTEELKRVTSLEDNKTYECIKDETNNENDQNNDCYDEIDQIYDYVRGFAPLPERIKSDFDCHKPVDPLKASILNSDNKPEPPPIITIPSLQNKRMSYPMSSQKVSVNSKKANKFFPRDHIFSKNNKNELKISYFPNVRIPCRTESANKIYLPTTTTQHNYQSNGQKLFIKSSSGQRNTWKSNRFLKYAKHVSSPFRTDSFNDTAFLQQNDVKSKEFANNEKCRSSRSLTTSPIFNIRYKSMNNLHFIAPPGMDFNNTLESSNSGQTSSGSGSKDVFRDPKPKFPKLSRSLTNIFWDITGNLVAIDNMDKLNNEINNRKNKSGPHIPLLPVHLDFFNISDRLQQQQQNKEQNCKMRQLATLYL